MNNRTSDPRNHSSCALPRRPRGATAVRRRISGAVTSIIEWLRSGHPEEAPPTGYSPLLALHGPRALTRQQTRKILDELAGAPADIIDIGVAITKATGKLPTQTQIRAIAAALSPS